MPQSAANTPAELLHKVLRSLMDVKVAIAEQGGDDSRAMSFVIGLETQILEFFKEPIANMPTGSAMPPGMPAGPSPEMVPGGGPPGSGLSQLLGPEGGAGGPMMGSPMGPSGPVSSSADEMRRLLSR